MSQTSPENTQRADYQSIFDSALQAYKKRTGKDLPSNQLFRRLESCVSPDDIITLLRHQIPAFDQSGSSNDGLTRWLDPTVKVINAFSATLGDTITLVSLTPDGLTRPESAYIQTYPPAGVIFTGIGILLSVSTISLSIPFADLFLL